MHESWTRRVGAATLRRVTWEWIRLPTKQRVRAYTYISRGFPQTFSRVSCFPLYPILRYIRNLCVSKVSECALRRCLFVYEESRWDFLTRCVFLFCSLCDLSRTLRKKSTQYTSPVQKVSIRKFFWQIFNRNLRKCFYSQLDSILLLHQY